MKRRYYVYVVELRGPRLEVYVGSSAFVPSLRFVKHKLGRTPSVSKHVEYRGRRLRPDLYQHLNPFWSREAAKSVEKRLARHLERQGYTVYGACGRRQGCRI